MDGLDCCVEKPEEPCDGSVFIDLVEGTVETYCDGMWVQHPFCCPTVNVIQLAYVPDLTDPTNNSSDNYSQFVIGSDGNPYYIDGDGTAIALGTTPTVTEDTAPTITLPSSSNEGDVYINTTVEETYVYDGTNWVLVPDCCPIVNQGGPITPPVSLACDANSPYRNMFVVDTDGATWYFDKNGCPIMMSTPPEPCSDDFTYAAGSTLVCAGEDIDLFADGGVSYSWTGPGGYTSTTQSPSRSAATLAMSGLYTVDMVQASGCTARRAVYVRVIICPPPVSNVEINC